MALTNPSKFINVQELSYFEGKLAVKYQGKVIAIDGITATTVEGALSEILGKVNALPSSIVPKGTKTFSQLAPATDLVAANVGFMWNISDAFTTTSDFVEGAGKAIPAGANVYVANPEANVYKYDVFQGMIDLSGYKTLQTAVQDPTASGNAISFIDSISQNENGVITPTKKTLPSVVASTGGEGGNAGLMSATDKEKLDGIDYSGKADKVSGATSGNFAGLDSNGNLTDSGSKASDFKTKQTAVTDPTAGSTPTVEFIATIAQDANGEIVATKQPVRDASASQSGLMSAAHYSKLDAISVASDSDIDEIFA